MLDESPGLTIRTSFCESVTSAENAEKSGRSAADFQKKHETYFVVLGRRRNYSWKSEKASQACRRREQCEKMKNGTKDETLHRR